MDTFVFKESITYTHPSLFTEINHLPTILIFSRHPKTTCYTIPFLITYSTIQVPQHYQSEAPTNPIQNIIQIIPKNRTLFNVSLRWTIRHNHIYLDPVSYTHLTLPTSDLV